MKNFKLIQFQEEGPGYIFLCYLHKDEKDNILYSEGEILYPFSEDEDPNKMYEEMNDALRNDTVRHRALYKKDIIASTILDEEVINWELRKGWDQ
jgi:hypothetical protein